MRYLRFVALAAVAVLSTGCIRATYTLNLKPDGSGTIHQTMAMTAAALQQAGALMTSETTSPTGSIMPSEEKLRESAAGMGEGVRFVSMAPYKENGFDGVTAVFAFDDIRKLSLGIDNMMAGMDTPVGAGASDAKVNVGFTRQGDRTILTLGMPPIPKSDPAVADAAQDAGEKMPPEAEMMMKQLLNGLLFEVAINIEGTVIQTNAPYVDGNRIVLLQLDGTELMKAGLNMGQMMGMSSGAMNLEEQLLKTPGVKVVTIPELKIEFR